MVQIPAWLTSIASGRFLPGLAKDLVAGLVVRFDRSPLASMDQLQDFLHSRASYIAQTSLYGYLKTRMGTRYRVMFEDEVFSGAIRLAAARIFASCLSDLTIFVMGLLGKESGLSHPQLMQLAARLFHQALAAALEDFEPVGHHTKDALINEAEAALQNRLVQASAEWHKLAKGHESIHPEAWFTGSEHDLVRYAPVIDAFKQADREIIMGSIRYRWRDVRMQLYKRLDAGRVGEDWRAREDSVAI
ncbi:MAG: hypothetical protein AAF418_04020 [Pseudomonadota bacterium]